jgi:hypothetical protein
VGDLPIACTLDVESRKARRADLLPGLVARADACQETAEGYRLRFPATDEAWDAIVTTVRLERECCQFLRLQVTAEPGLGPLWLEISGPSGTKDFLASLGCRWPERVL